MRYNIQKIRDLSILSLSDGQQLVIACDSNASVGEKPADYHKCVYEEAAVSALKVPMMEVIATGAEPMIVVNNLCVEMEGTGKRIIEIMRKELERHEYTSSVQLTGSTEDNMPTTQTGIGVTVIGMLSSERSRIGHTQPDDCIVCVGKPRSGVEKYYSEFQTDVANIGTVKRLVREQFVHEILPVGSKGARYEAEQLCTTSGLCFAPVDSPIDLQTSAGSSTAVLCSIRENDFERLRAVMTCPCCIIGFAQRKIDKETKECQ